MAPAPVERPRPGGEKALAAVERTPARGAGGAPRSAERRFMEREGGGRVERQMLLALPVSSNKYKSNQQLNRAIRRRHEAPDRPAPAQLIN